MGPTARSLLNRYGFAALAVTLALFVRLILDQLLGDRLPFLFFCLAVVAVAWHGGFGPSCLALALSVVAGVYFFLPPRYSLVTGVMEHGVVVTGFLFLGVTIGL